MRTQNLVCAPLFTRKRPMSLLYCTTHAGAMPWPSCLLPCCAVRCRAVSSECSCAWEQRASLSIYGSCSRPARRSAAGLRIVTNARVCPVAGFPCIWLQSMGSSALCTGTGELVLGSFMLLYGDY